MEYRKLMGGEFSSVGDGKQTLQDKYLFNQRRILTDVISDSTTYFGQDEGNGLAGKLNKELQSGFTLLELLIVVTIVSLLGTIALPSYVRYVQSAKSAAAQTQIRIFDNSLKGYDLMFDEFPQTNEGLNALVKAEMLDGVPIDPWGNPYLYNNPSTHVPGKPYDIISLGSDGELGGNGYDADITNHTILRQITGEDQLDSR